MGSGQDRSSASPNGDPSYKQTLVALHNDHLVRESSLSAVPAIITGLVVLALFFSGVVLWSVYVPLKYVVTAQGEVAFRNKRQPVQHLEGGIVRKILVRDGDTVQAGQPLIMLESSQVRPLVTMLEEQNIAEIASMARLEAESRDLPSIEFPNSLLSRRKEPSVAKILQAEEKLFSARLDAFRNQTGLLQLQMAQIKESHKGSQERLAARNQEIASLKEQLNANQTLLKEGYVTRTVVLDLQRILAERTGERDLLAASIASEKQRMSEFEQRIRMLKSERVQGAINELKLSGLKRIDQEERIRPMRDTLERQIIRAPVTGKVVGLKVTTIGNVIQPRESLMEIAPTGDALILEARIELKDISEVKVGQEAEARITAFNTRTTPPLKARVTYISDDRIMPSALQGQPYYAAHLVLDPESLKALGGQQLMPGMSAMITVATKPRTPFDFIFVPMRDRFRNAVHAR